MKKLLLAVLTLMCVIICALPVACGNNSNNGSGSNNGDIEQGDDGKINDDEIVEGDDDEQFKDLTPTEGLEFREIAGGYEVTGIGTATVTDLVIPSTYNGKPVISIYGEIYLSPEAGGFVHQGAFWGCASLTRVFIPDSVTSIGDNAFIGCYNLTRIIIPDSVTHIGKSAFSSCYSLTIYCEAESRPFMWENFWNIMDCPVVWDCNNNEIADDGNIYASIKGIRYALKEGDASIARQPKSISEEITVPKAVKFKGNVYRVTSIAEWAFSRCNLTKINIPKGVTSIGNYAFGYCSNLTSVIMPDGMTSIGQSAFSNCTSLTSINIPDGVTSIGIWAFNNCSSLKDVTIPGSVTRIEGNTFSECSSLTSVTISDGVTIIGDQSFSGCTSLTNINIPDSVTLIEGWAFRGCSSLKKIIIPVSVTTLGGAVFEGCSGLTIYCRAASEPSDWYSNWNFSNCPVVWGYKGK